MPALNALYAARSGQGLVIVAVTLPYAVLLDRRHQAAIWVGQRKDLPEEQLDRLLAAAARS